MKYPQLVEGHLVRPENDVAKSFVSSIPFIQKKGTKNKVSTTAFFSDEYLHVSALLVTSVNPYSTTYKNPSVELLHNPQATKPLPRGWLKVGKEYWLEGNSFRNSDHGSPTTEAIGIWDLPHPGRIIKESCLDLLGLSVTEAAKVLGVAHPELWRVLNGHAAVSPEMAIRLEKAGWRNAELWLHRQTIYNLAQARRK